MSQECRHIKPNGAKCGSPALQDKPYCYFHTRLHRFTAEPPIGVMDNFRLPVLEDRSAIQIAIAQVLDALCSCRIDNRRAGIMLYALQIASQNVERGLYIIPSTTVESITLTETGEELAPEERICHRDECAACADRDTCKDYDPE
jgi:hypothetical protein